MCDNDKGQSTRAFMCPACNAFHQVTLRCGSRFQRTCPSCSKIWLKKTRAEYYRKIESMKTPKFVTLTLLKTGTIMSRLPLLFSMVHRARKYIRRRGYRIRAFVSILEPPNHVHCVWDCDYIPRFELSDIWLLATGDSFIVDIRRFDNVGRMVNYISKYITKMAAWSGVNLAAFDGIHIKASWGPGVNENVRPMICLECGHRGLLKAWDIPSNAPLHPPYPP